MDPVPISSFPLSPACLIYSSTSAGPGCNFQSTGLTFLFSCGQWELWSLSKCLEPSRLLTRCFGERLPLPSLCSLPLLPCLHFPPPQLGFQPPYSISMPVLRSPRCLQQNILCFSNLLFLLVNSIQHSDHPFLGTLASRHFQITILFWFSSYLTVPSQSTFLAPSGLPTLYSRMKSPFHPSLRSLLSCLVLWL